MISCELFKKDSAQSSQLPTIIICFMIHYSIDRWLVPPKPKPPPRSLPGKLFALCPYQLSRPYVKNNYVYLIFLTFFMLINIGLFVSRSIEYCSESGFVIVARACGKLHNIRSYTCDYSDTIYVKPKLRILYAHALFLSPYLWVSFLNPLLELADEIYYGKCLSVYSICVFSFCSRYGLFDLLASASLDNDAESISQAKLCIGQILSSIRSAQILNV
jgi:hypothetical protein